MKKTRYLLLCLVFTALVLLLTSCISVPGATSTTPPSTPPSSSFAPSTAPPSISVPPSSQAPAPSPTPGAASAAVIPGFAAMLDVVEHSIAQINVTDLQGQGAGSAWVIDSNGTLVTCNHVIAGATKVTVVLNGVTYNATSVNGDTTTDIAIVKINATNLPALKTADMSRIRVGDWAVAVGNPLGEGISAKEGIVSRLGVTVPVSPTEIFNNLIETSAPINPGNSGGALVNVAGEVMGVTSLKVSQTGIEGLGYAINIIGALPVIQKLSAK